VSKEDKVVYAVDGHAFKLMVGAALAWLREHQATINALNVFPVPDGDTGTNMTLTMTSAWNEIAELDEGHVGKLVGKVAHGALMGARGNSGVILSQIWRGIARGLEGKESFGVADLAIALRDAAETAYKGVVKPVEGTILTVIREVAEEAAVAAQETNELLTFLQRVLQRAMAAEARTPQLLPVLRQAGVVDSGGQGLVVILEGMLRQLLGLSLQLDAAAPVIPAVSTVAEMPTTDGLQFDSAYPYDVQFIIVGQDMDVAAIRQTIESMGDCPLVVGDAQTIKVHVHVPDPGVPISYGVTRGGLRDVVIEDMRAQYAEFVAQRDGHAAAPGLVFGEEERAIGAVTVVAGAGLQQVFLSLGATAVVLGGQTMNPSTAQILQAVEQSHAEQVIILPNNKNILMAAQQAAAVSTKKAIVVPTRSIPQGVAALLVLDQQASLEDNLATMTQAFREVITGEVTWATRDVELNGIEVREGDAIGLLDGQLVVDTGTFDEAVRWLLAEAGLETRELVTLYYGEGVDEEEAQHLHEELVEIYPDMEFEVVAGGQPHYPYIISIE